MWEWLKKWGRTTYAKENVFCEEICAVCSTWRYWKWNQKSTVEPNTKDLLELQQAGVTCAMLGKGMRSRWVDDSTTSLFAWTCRTAKHMMFVILISIGQVLTPYGDDFPICRQVMSGHRTLESTWKMLSDLLNFLCLEGRETLKYIWTTIINVNKLSVDSLFSLFSSPSCNLKNLKKSSWQQSQDMSHKLYWERRV